MTDLIFAGWTEEQWVNAAKAHMDVHRALPDQTTPVAVLLAIQCWWTTNHLTPPAVVQTPDNHVGAGTIRAGTKQLLHTAIARVFAFAAPSPSPAAK